MFQLYLIRLNTSCLEDTWSFLKFTLVPFLHGLLLECFKDNNLLNFYDLPKSQCTYGQALELF